MKNSFQFFAGKLSDTSEAFQAERQAFKEDVAIASSILRVGKKSSYIDFIGGKGMQDMHLSLVKTFPVANKNLARFSADISMMLGEVRKGAQGDFVIVAERIKRRGGRHPSLHEWDALKSGVQQDMKKVAASVVQHWHAHNAKPAEHAVLKAGL